MNYYYDLEFLEGKQDKRVFGIKYGETKNTIDIISIGIVSEDNREYYAISKDFNLKEAWNRWDGEFHEPNAYEKYHQLPKRKKYWIRENVLKPIYYEWINKDIDFHEVSHFTYKNFQKLMKKYGKTNKEISKEVYDFVNPDLGFHVTAYNNSELKKGGRLDENFTKHDVTSDGEYYFAQPKLYGYYSAYDHVALCWLFGRMIDLPKGFPMMTMDIQQQIEEYKIDKNKLLSEIPQINCHNALADARWNKELHEFLKKV